MNSRSIGGEAVALRQVKLDEKLQALGFSRKQCSTAIGNIIGRMVQPGSELSTHQGLQEITRWASCLGVIMDSRAYRPFIVHRIYSGRITMPSSNSCIVSTVRCSMSRKPLLCSI